jgi:hypothetical protein
MHVDTPLKGSQYLRAFSNHPAARLKSESAQWQGCHSRLSVRHHAMLSVVAEFGETAFDGNLGDGVPPRILEHDVNDLAIC